MGSGICLVIERDPIITAKEVASVDHLSGGRLEFGVGAGWNREEMANHGTDPRRRMRVMQERIEAMKAIWTQDEASYSGEFVSFDRIWSWPKPAQRPHPPVLVGGLGPTVLGPRAGLRRRLVSQLRAGRPAGRASRQLRARADRHIDVMAMGVPAGGGGARRADRRRLCAGVHWIPSGNQAVVERALERWESAIAEVTGEA